MQSDSCRHWARAAPVGGWIISFEAQQVGSEKIE